MIRNDSIHIDILVETRDTSTYRVHWVNECAFTLSFLTGSEELRAFYTDRLVYVNITDTYEHGYVCEASVQGIDMSVKMFCEEIE